MVASLSRSIPRPGASRLTTRALVVTRLRGMILGATLRPGERLRVDDLAHQLGVSPTPVRQALHQLAAECTVTLDPYRGFSIARLSAGEAEDLYSTRAPLEELAARIAVPRLDSATLGELRDAVARQSAACAAGVAALTFLREERQVERAAQLGVTLLDGLHRLARRFPQFVRSARGLGLLAALEYANADPSQGGVGHGTSDAFGLRVAAAARRRGLWLRRGASLSILGPPLIATAQDIDWLLETLGQSIEDVVSAR